MSCLRCSGVLLKMSLVDGPSLPGPLQQFVRGIKPRWLPKSKSKIFYVRKPTPIIPEEEEMLKTAYFHYRTSMRAVRKFLITQQLAKKEKMHKQLATEDQDNMAEFQSMEEQISQWNDRVAVIREAESAKVTEKQEERTQRRMERDQLQRETRAQKAKERLHKDLEDSKSFITLDTLDMEIEKLLNVRHDYNFAIDRYGNKISDSVVEDENKLEELQKPESLKS